MSNEVGTPKTIEQAIRNGVAEGVKASGFISDSKTIKEIEAHVRDFLAHRFGIAIMRAELMKNPEFAGTLQVLFMEIFSREPVNKTAREFEPYFNKNLGASDTEC